MQYNLLYSPKQTLIVICISYCSEINHVLGIVYLSATNIFNFLSSEFVLYKLFEWL